MTVYDGQIQKFAYYKQGLLLKKAEVPSPYLELTFQFRSIAEDHLQFSDLVWGLHELLVRYAWNQAHLILGS